MHFKSFAWNPSIQSIYFLPIQNPAEFQHLGSRGLRCVALRCYCYCTSLPILAHSSINHLGSGRTLATLLIPATILPHLAQACCNFISFTPPWHATDNASLGSATSRQYKHMAMPVRERKRKEKKIEASQLVCSQDITPDDIKCNGVIKSVETDMRKCHC